MWNGSVDRGSFAKCPDHLRKDVCQFEWPIYRLGRIHNYRSNLYCFISQQPSGDCRNLRLVCDDRGPAHQTGSPFHSEFPRFFYFGGCHGGAPLVGSLICGQRAGSTRHYHSQPNCLPSGQPQCVNLCHPHSKSHSLYFANDRPYRGRSLIKLWNNPGHRLHQ